MSMAAQAPYLALFVWGWYLIYRLTLQRQMAPALRYAIGAVTVNWIWIEAGSRADLYEEIWIKPVEYPLAMSTVLAVLIALLAIMYQQRGPRRSVDAFASA
jgi:ABC-type branched-subunit amino acid transport system permease subunit